MEMNKQTKGKNMAQCGKTADWIRRRTNKKAADYGIASSTENTSRQAGRIKKMPSRVESQQLSSEAADPVSYTKAKGKERPRDRKGHKNSANRIRETSIKAPSANVTLASILHASPEVERSGEAPCSVIDQENCISWRQEFCDEFLADYELSITAVSTSREADGKGRVPVHGSDQENPAYGMESAHSMAVMDPLSLFWELLNAEENSVELYCGEAQEESVDWVRVSRKEEALDYVNLSSVGGGELVADRGMIIPCYWQSQKISDEIAYNEVPTNCGIYTKDLFAPREAKQRETCNTSTHNEVTVSCRTSSTDSGISRTRKRRKPPRRKSEMKNSSTMGVARNEKTADDVIIPTGACPSKKRLSERKRNVPCRGVEANSVISRKRSGNKVVTDCEINCEAGGRLRNSTYFVEAQQNNFSWIKSTQHVKVTESRKISTGKGTSREARGTAPCWNEPHVNSADRRRDTQSKISADNLVLSTDLCLSQEEERMSGEEEENYSVATQDTLRKVSAAYGSDLTFLSASWEVTKFEMVPCSERRGKDLQETSAVRIHGARNELAAVEELLSAISFESQAIGLSNEPSLGGVRDKSADWFLEACEDVFSNCTAVVGVSRGAGERMDTNRVESQKSALAPNYVNFSNNTGASQVVRRRRKIPSDSSVWVRGAQNEELVKHGVQPTVPYKRMEAKRRQKTPYNGEVNKSADYCLRGSRSVVTADNGSSLTASGTSHTAGGTRKMPIRAGFLEKYSKWTGGSYKEDAADCVNRPTVAGMNRGVGGRRNVPRRSKVEYSAHFVQDAHNKSAVDNRIRSLDVGKPLKEQSGRKLCHSQSKTKRSLFNRESGARNSKAAEYDIIYTPVDATSAAISTPGGVRRNQKVPKCGGANKSSAIRRQGTPNEISELCNEKYNNSDDWLRGVCINVPTVYTTLSSVLYAQPKWGKRRNDCQEDKKTSDSNEEIENYETLSSVEGKECRKSSCYNGKAANYGTLSSVEGEECRKPSSSNGEAANYGTLSSVESEECRKSSCYNGEAQEGTPDGVRGAGNEVAKDYGVRGAGIEIAKDYGKSSVVVSSSPKMEKRKGKCSPEAQEKYLRWTRISSPDRSGSISTILGLSSEAIEKRKLMFRGKHHHNDSIREAPEDIIGEDIIFSFLTGLSRSGKRRKIQSSEGTHKSPPNCMKR